MSFQKPPLQPMKLRAQSASKNLKTRLNCESQVSIEPSRSAFDDHIAGLPLLSISTKALMSLFGDLVVRGGRFLPHKKNEPGLGGSSQKGGGGPPQRMCLRHFDPRGFVCGAQT